MHASLRSIFCAALVSCGAAALAATPATHSPGKPVTDNAGRKLYHVLLDEASVDKTNADGEAAALRPMDPRNAEDFRAWHKPKVRKLVRALERAYGLEAQTMTSYLLPAFSAYVADDVASRLATDARVQSMHVIPEGGIEFSSWSDQTSGGETIPWGKIAIGTNDGASTGNLVYMIDGGAQPHNDLTIIYAPVNPTQGNLNPMHANHVAGILGAAMNGVGVRGVNPGATIVSVNRGQLQNEFTQAMDWSMADAEARGIYAVANMSSSGTGMAAGTVIAAYARRLSNRLLYVQAAGNNRQDACNNAYGPTNAYDGILVVGGIDENGAQAIPFDNQGNPDYSVWEPGSNWGNCIEVWGPSMHILSTWSTSATATALLSGTSMAAPHVAALAARYGGTSTTPVERERYIRSKVFGTGFADESSATIVVPSYTQPAAFSVPSRLPIANVTADSTYSFYSPWRAVDSVYTDWGWISGHAAPGWIELDLGSTRTLESVRLSPDQDPPGNVVHYVYAGDSPSPTTLVAVVSGNGAVLEPFVAYLGFYSARYVRIYTASSPSWVAWREIEVYGY